MLKKYQKYIIVIIIVVVIAALVISLVINYKRAEIANEVINQSYATHIFDLSVSSLDFNFYFLYNVDAQDPDAVVRLFDILQFENEYNRMIYAHSRLVDFLIRCKNYGYIKLPSGHILNKQHPYIPASEAGLTFYLAEAEDIYPIELSKIKDNLEKAMRVRERIHTIIQKHGVDSNINTGINIIEEVSAIWYNDDGSLKSEYN